MAKQSKIRSKYKVGHRAHKRDSLPAKPTDIGRDTRKAAKREARADYIAGLEWDAKAKLDAEHDEALMLDEALQVIVETATPEVQERGLPIPILEAIAVACTDGVGVDGVSYGPAAKEEALADAREGIEGGF